MGSPLQYLVDCVTAVKPSQRHKNLEEALRDEAMRVADILIRKANDRGERLAKIEPQIAQLNDICEYARKANL